MIQLNMFSIVPDGLPVNYARSEASEYRGLARSGDRETAKKAADQFRAKSLCEQIVWMLRRFPEGLTIAQLAKVLERKEVSVSPRMKQLVESRMIRDSGRRRVNEGSRTEAIVWEAV